MSTKPERRYYPPQQPGHTRVNTILKALGRAESPDQERAVLAAAKELMLRQRPRKMDHSHCDHLPTATAQRKCQVERAVELIGKQVEEAPAGGRIDHSRCQHPKTATARKKCRAGRP